MSAPTDSIPNRPRSVNFSNYYWLYASLCTSSSSTCTQPAGCTCFVRIFFILKHFCHDGWIVFAALCETWNKKHRVILASSLMYWYVVRYNWTKKILAKRICFYSPKLNHCLILWPWIELSWINFIVIVLWCTAMRLRGNTSVETKTKKHRHNTNITM